LELLVGLKAQALEQVSLEWAQEQEVIVPVNDIALLILNEARTNGKLACLIEVEAGTYVLPLRWLVSDKMKSACLLDKALLMTNIEGVSIKGIPGPRTLGAPIFAYMLLLIFGWIMLSTPILVRFRLAHPQYKSIDEAKEIVATILSRSIFDSVELARTQEAIQRARSVRDLALVVARVRE
jgi:hypothetical protein